MIQHTRINLLSGPRNISTAMMYAFAQRTDTIVIDEPFYAHFLKTTGALHPGRDEVLATQEADGKKVITDVINYNYPQPVVFFKQMTHHLIDLDISFLLQCKNIILLRDPKKVLHSYTKVVDNPRLESVGIKQSFELYEYLDAKKAHVMLVDTDTFLLHPEKGLKQMCASCGIPFYTSMLHWQAGARKEDGIWAKYWYANVHRSQGFEQPEQSEITLPEHVHSIYLQAKPFYDTLMNLIRD